MAPSCFVCAFVIASLGSAHAESCDAPPSERVSLTIGLEWFLNADHLPLVVGVRAGLFERLGIDVTLKEPADHWQAEKEIEQGTLDVAVTETLHLAIDSAAGKEVLGFSRFLHTDGGVMYLPPSGITRPRDMCNKTISYPGYPGPGGPAIVQTMVEADGGACSPEMYGKHDGGFYHTKALQERSADVATLIFYNFEVIEARAQGLEPRFFSLKEWGVPDFCQLVLFTTPSRYLALKPALRKLVLGMRAAVGIIHREPDRARQVFDEYLQSRGELPDPSSIAVHRETMNATLSAFPNDNSIASDYFDNLMAWLVHTKQVDANAAATSPPRNYWTNEIAL
uniref:Thiamine pyrimidine synthase n=1 Tax=Calcidiscus leptoporus TaxID=127549 RepID=A0A7S0NQE5_9EUKA|mmetsp:Transcript_13521/g.31072  ORF Transcript_13521/g.31072 Transcript_13521/m.31072 type:complete len:338 (+) Transcript_13521:143-1156(+)|eukprot:CAMPEP_0119360104 /NCGR_PEP_ID=MMETSP1334-20130426/7814_1 /TAXON_ID=127549 /ORGANISM="Calcidiscus leptoporus, Strain RCC1130" /LENGTH=337 /DNA_ID=CAMNT_0007374889 /DNA_START=143 /DNA_END=1156 /DNA_ORIENTATION=-